ncbi:MAG: hypothetical protein JWO65_2019 [Sphingomonas bacterium]|nr:hypothetical protein [Sphingomonas bacterium]
MIFPRRLILAALLLGIEGCSQSSPDAPAANATVEEPSIAQNTDDPAAFVPLKSAAVKDAIHRALRSGETQRWQDGKLGGYAVPSFTPGANGCRAVRYTVDQRPGAAYESITACDASR